MNEWTVKTTTGDITVQATAGEVTHGGALVFSVNGRMTCVYAAGHWLSCTLTTPARGGGYGG